MKKIIILFLTAILLTLTSCSDSYLHRELEEDKPEKVDTVGMNVEDQKEGGSEDFVLYPDK